jgi:hypothetical protein
MFGISPTDVDPLSKPWLGGWRTKWGYLDLRGDVSNVTKLTAVLATYVAAGLGDKVTVIKMGDEIGLAKPPSSNPNATDAAFVAWAQSKHLQSDEVGCPSWRSCSFNMSWAIRWSNPKRFYFSSLFCNDYGIYNSSYMNATVAITNTLPHALAAANLAPNDSYLDTDLNQTFLKSYLPDAFKWVRAMRAGTFNLPFTEDYIFQIPVGLAVSVSGLIIHSVICLRVNPSLVNPLLYDELFCLCKQVGSQQMFSLVVDVERAAVRQQQHPPFERRAGPLAVRYASLPAMPATVQPLPGRPIMQYVMAHFPGTTPNSWRRYGLFSLFYGWTNIRLCVYRYASSRFK